MSPLLARSSTISPPSTTRIKRGWAASATQTAPSASMQIAIRGDLDRGQGLGDVGGRRGLAERRPRAALTEPAVVQVEGTEPVVQRFGDDERGAIGREDHAVGKGEAV